MLKKIMLTTRVSPSLLCLVDGSAGCMRDLTNRRGTDRRR